MVRWKEAGVALAPLNAVTAILSSNAGQTSGCCPSKKLTVWASMALGSLDVGSLDALDPRHPARLNPGMVRGQDMNGALLFAMGNDAHQRMMELIATELAGNAGVAGVVFTDLKPEAWPTPVLERSLQRLSNAVRQMAPDKAVVLQTEGGALPWTNDGPLARLAGRIRPGNFTHWIHGAALDEPGEAASLQGALRSPVPLTLEVSLVSGGSLAVPAAQSLHAVTDSRFGGLSVRSISHRGLLEQDLRGFRSLLDADAVESRLSMMAERAGMLQTPVSQMPTPGASMPVDVLPLAPPVMPSPQIFTAPETGGRQGSFLSRALDAAVAKAGGDSGAPPMSKDSTPPPLKLDMAEPMPTPDSAPPAAPPVPEIGVLPGDKRETARPEPEAPRQPDPIRVSNPAAPRVAPRWAGLRATTYATGEDIEAFTDAPTRQPKPLSSVQFKKIDHGDTESPLAPTNRSREVLDFAAQARRTAVRSQAGMSDAPVLQVLTSTGRSFTGRASLQGTLWRVELPSGGVVNLPADRVVSAEPVSGN
jgi:hypothetical protein